MECLHLQEDSPPIVGNNSLTSLRFSVLVLGAISYAPLSCHFLMFKEILVTVLNSVPQSWNTLLELYTFLSNLSLLGVLVLPVDTCMSCCISFLFNVFNM